MEVKLCSSACNLLRRNGEGVGVYLYSFFNLGAVWEWVVSAMPRLFNPGNDPTPII
jgi:hypothetical protein